MNNFTIIIECYIFLHVSQKNALEPKMLYVALNVLFLTRMILVFNLKVKICMIRSTVKLKIN